MSDSMDDLNDDFAECPLEPISDWQISPIQISADRVSALLTRATCRLGAEKNESEKCRKSCSGACTSFRAAARDEKKNPCSDPDFEHAKDRRQGGE
jgi:hypothetical protein